MRPPLLAALAALLAGCTSGFPEDTRVVAELEVGDLAAGGAAEHTFTLDAPSGYLALGYRTGPGRDVHVALRAPDGTRFDTQAGQPAGPCAIRDPTAGRWGLEVAADLLDGFLRGGKFTVRAGAGLPPALFACVDDRFPGRGRNVTLGVWRLNLSAGEEASFAFELVEDAAALGVVTRPDARNLTVWLMPPGGESVPVDEAPRPPPRGVWHVQARVAAESGASWSNATLAVQATGS